jgi:cytochrome b6-f complex iron-sulfur subunit
MNGAEVDRDRRRFLTWLWTGLGLVALAEIVAISFSFLKPRHRAAAGAQALFVCGPVRDFAPGSVTAFPAGKFYLARLDDGGFLALHRECTHLGCTLPWSEAEGRFTCPCHASTFDITGQVLGPPAPRPLDLFTVRIENDIVKVDTRRRLRRTAFRSEQVVRS